MKTDILSVFRFLCQVKLGCQATTDEWAPLFTWAARKIDKLSILIANELLPEVE